MISGLAASNASFLADLNNTEDRISRANQQISSGIRVSKASDDPEAVTPLLDYQNQINQITQLLSNLNSEKTVATMADGALQSASSLLNQLLSIAALGATGTTTAATRATLGVQVQQITQQLVSLANTTMEGRFIFGGDAPGTQPYTFDWNSAGGVSSSGSPANTATISDLDGGSIVPGLTAAQIFDARLPGGSPDPGNVFQAAYALGTALLANDQASLQTASTEIQAAATHVNESAVVYGNTENWIQQAAATATSRSVTLTDAISALRDTDLVAAATELTQGRVALEAALAAHANLTTKSLFSYLG
jgi:flagellar hook-associated protein 3 FlgL